MFPGRWPGQVVTNATHDGWLLARFTAAVADQIVAALAGAPQLPSPVTTVRLIQAADTGEAGVVGMDPDGFYRLGRGWPWVCPDLLPNGQLLPYTATDQPGIDPAELPAPGQDTFTGLGYLMWLDEHDELVLRPIHPDGLHPADQAVPPDYGDLDAEDEPQFRAVEHVLRQAATSRVTLTGPAAAFTAADIEALLITAADAVCAGMDALSSRQIDLATRAYQLLVADDDDADSTDADSARG